MDEIIIKKVETIKERKAFVEFPLKLYKGNKYFVPPLYGDEMKMFTSKNAYSQTCNSEFFLAYKNGELVGRIQAIVQKQFNEIYNEKRVRFTRFDSINDQNVANRLFLAVENYAKSQGLDTVCGPLGYSDLEREGLLIEGFEELSTFEEQYNYPYYQTLIENLRYQKEVDWTEHKIYLPDEINPKIDRVAENTLRLNKLHIAGEKMGKREFIKTYKDGIFHCLDEAYKHLYGVVPFTEDMKAMLIDNFNLIVARKYVLAVADENERVVAFALCFPSIGEALQKSGGRLTPCALLKLLRTVKKPKVLDLALIGILPEYQSRGVNAIALKIMMDFLKDPSIDHMETNLTLESNHAVLSQWKYFKAVYHKRRRSYVKNLTTQ